MLEVYSTGQNMKLGPEEAADILIQHMSYAYIPCIPLPSDLCDLAVADNLSMDCDRGFLSTFPSPVTVSFE